MEIEQTTPLKLCLLNVHMWTDANDDDNTKQVYNLISDFQPDIAVFNEVGGRMTYDSVMTGYRNHYAYCAYGFGNGVSVRNESSLLNSQFYKIEFERPEGSKYWSNDRNAIRARSIWKLPTFYTKKDIQIDIYCTHLDHRMEETRLEQLEALMQNVDQRRPHLICGDFNALCKDDFSENYLEQIARIREAGNWEIPRFEVTEKMKSLGYIDVFRRLNPSLKDRVIATSRFGTRIDFIWMSPSFLDLVDWEKSSATIVGDKKLSDHRSVLLRLYPNDSSLPHVTKTRLKRGSDSDELHLSFFDFHWPTHILPVISLVGCLVLALHLHNADVTRTHCGNWEWLPSISSTIGNNAPEKYLWRAGIPLYLFPKMSLGILNYLFMKSRWARKKERGFGADFKFFDPINVLALVTGLLEDLSLLLLTVISSHDDRPWHELGFTLFILFAHVHFVFFLVSFWLSRQPFSEKEQIMFRRLLYLALAHGGVFLCAIFVYFRHKLYCEPGMFSMFAFCEWTVVFLNVAFHMVSQAPFHESMKFIVLVKDIDKADGKD